MQAAMFQAYARGQAAKAMMSNPRTVANNIQAVAQQIGIKAPQPPGHVNAKSIPTSLMSQPSAMEIRESTGNFVLLISLFLLNFTSVL